MLAKVIRSRRKHAVSEALFTKRIAYCCRKASTVSVGNLAGDWRDAAFQMNVAARRHSNLRDACYHFILSWGDGEDPRDAEIIAAARRAIRDLGGAAHQYVIAVHRDRRNVHVHIVLNRVHPTNGKALSLSHDFAKLELACRRIEHAFGWPPDRGRFAQKIADGKVKLVPKPPKHWNARQRARGAGLRPDPGTLRSATRRRGRAPLRDRLPSRILQELQRVIEAATGWPALHAGFRKYRLRYVPRGPGARVLDQATGDWMPACHLGTAFAMPRLTARFGAFVAMPESPAGSKAALSNNRRAYVAARQSRRNDIDGLLTRQRDERRRLGKVLSGMRRSVTMAFRQALRAQQKAEMCRFRAARPLPQLSGFEPAAKAEPSDPLVQYRRRYRHFLREQKAAGKLQTDILDHTYLRQLWHRPFHDAEGGLQVPNIKDGGTNLRQVGDKTILLPRRGNEGVQIGYVLVEQQPNGALRVLDRQNSLGLSLIGPQDGPRCIIAGDAAAGIAHSVQYPGDLVIIASPMPSDRQVEQIGSIVGDRFAAVLASSGDLRSSLVKRLSPLLGCCPAVPPPDLQPPDATKSILVDDDGDMAATFSPG